MRIVRLRRFAPFVVVAAAACTTGSKQAAEELSFPVVPVGSHVTHAVQSARLQEAMYGLEEIATERIPDELDPKGRRRPDLEELANLADALARAAASIPDSLAANELPADDERRFRELSEQLVRDAFALRDRAIRREVGSAREETEQLLATCNACHAFARPTPTASAPGHAETTARASSASAPRR